MGSECTAAVNLMSMTRPQSSLHNYAAIASQHQHVADTAQESQEQCRSDADEPVSVQPDCMEHDEAEQQESQAALIREHARSCAAIKFEVHLAKREAAAADAAVAAVSQVLNAKEDAAKMAQAAVRKAEKRLKQLLEQTDALS